MTTNWADYYLNLTVYKNWADYYLNLTVHKNHTPRLQARNKWTEVHLQPSEPVIIIPEFTNMFMIPFKGLDHCLRKAEEQEKKTCFCDYFTLNGKVRRSQCGLPRQFAKTYTPISNIYTSG